MGLSSFHRDPKSCLERWKNYLRPGLKKGSLTPEEQSLVISLQSKHGNKWNLIASHLPGRTPKRLGKWWEVFKEKQIKNNQKKKNHQQCCYSMGDTGSNSNTGTTSVLRPQQGEYDHILETFADKYVVNKGKMLPDLSLDAPVSSFSPSMSSCNDTVPHVLHVPHVHGGGTYSSYQNLLPRFAQQSIPPWMSTTTTVAAAGVSATATGCNNSNSPSVSLSLSPGENGGGGGRGYVGMQQASTLTQLCRELEEARQSLMHHKKEANWRLSRLEQQLESEKARKKREKEEEIRTKIIALREEEESCLDRLNAEYREQLSAIQRDADAKEAKMMEMWTSKHAKLARFLGQFGSSDASIDHRRHHHPRSPFQQQQ